MSLDPDAARDHCMTERRDLVARTVDCATAVAGDWEGGTTTDRERVVPPLRAALDRAGVLGALPTLLAECVTAAGGELRAEPVAAPPYVVVTSVGPVCRATLDGGRLIVTLAVFRIEHGTGGTRYALANDRVEKVISVEISE